MTDGLAKCTRCRNTHKQSERVRVPSKKFRETVSDLVCPRCGCTVFFDATPWVAWCWASGLIETGPAQPSGSVPEGAVPLVRGPKYLVTSAMNVYARHGKGASAGKLLVPGIPEAEDQDAAMNALEAWLAWCTAGKGFDGLTVSQEAS